MMITICYNRAFPTEHKIRQLPYTLRMGLLAILLALMLIFTPPAYADKIVLASDVWCPFVCTSDQNRPGFILEVAQTIFATHGHEVEYKNLNWARAISETRIGNVNGILGAFHGDAPDFIFPEQELAIVGNQFFTLKGDPWHYQQVESLGQVKVGAIINYDYGDALNQYFEEHKFTARVNMLSGNNHPLKRGIQMLLNNRIDTFIEVGPVFWYTASQMGVSQNLQSAGNIEQQTKTYIAFSPVLASSKPYAQILSTGIQQLRQSGQLQIILHKYGLEDWR